MTKVVVLADTHTARAASSHPSRPLPPGAYPYLETADHILHAGDVTDPDLVTELRSLAPVTVVLGNSDGPEVADAGATTVAELSIDGVDIAMLHDTGLSRGRRARMAKLFPDARVVVFGHSHIPMNEDEDGLLLFNPGSPTWKRTAPFESMGILWIEGGEVEGEIFPV